MPHVVLNELYDARGQRTALEATVDGTRDFSNTYEYDLLGRMTQVQQYGVAGGNAVGEKRVDFRYNALGQFTMIQRFRDLAGGQMAAYSQFGYDAYGNLSAIEHRYPAGAMISQYSYTHDDLDRITSVVDPAGTTNYSYDETSQLVSADYSPLPTNPSPLADESYSYDLNGNRTNTGYVTAADNRLEQAEIDGKLHLFQYDSEGNLVTRRNLSTGEVTTYAWDRRNRLVRVAELIPNAADSPAIKEVTFTYDAFDRRIAKTVDPDGTGPQVAHSELFVYDGIHIALVFEDLDSSGPQASSLQSRHLFGPAVDMVLAEERPTNPQSPTSSPAKTYWLLADHLGSIRDIISPDCDGGGHIDYTAFGRVAAVFDYLGAAATLADLAATRFLFTGREYDAEIDLQFNRARYYDAAIGRWLSQDPISFLGGDANLYRYVGNTSTSLRDPSGLAEVPRLPTDQSGTWMGEKGNSWFILNEPIVLPDGTRVTQIEYKNGYPDLAPHSSGTVPIKVTGNDPVDQARADAAYRDKIRDKAWKRPDDKVWHHDPRTGEMQLVPRAVNNNKQAAHLGTASMAREAGHELTPAEARAMAQKKWQNYLDRKNKGKPIGPKVRPKNGPKPRGGSASVDALTVMGIGVGMLDYAVELSMDDEARKEREEIRKEGTTQHDIPIPIYSPADRVDPDDSGPIGPFGPPRYKPGAQPIGCLVIRIEIDPACPVPQVLGAEYVPVRIRDKQPRK